MSRRRLINALVALFVWIGAAAIANAYPDYIGKGYTNCATCHYSPTGGGFVNSYGAAQQEAFAPNVVDVPWIGKVRQKADVTGYDDDGKPQLQWGFGGDSRFGFSSFPGRNQKAGFTFFPMLLEVGGVVSYGKLVVYGSVGPKDPEAHGIGYKAFSREHWVQFRATETFSVRAGRIMLPFGLKLPDHTAYTRTDMGFDFFNQSYAAEADYVAERITASVAGFIGDLTNEPSQLRERGGVASVNYNIDARGTFGISGMYADSDLVRRELAAVFFRLRLLGASYAMAELDDQHRTSSGQGQNSMASFERLGWWIIESLDVYLEHGWRSEQVIAAGQSNVTQNRFIVGASWWTLPWVEIAPQLMLETNPSGGAYTSAFAQLHIYY